MFELILISTSTIGIVFIALAVDGVVGDPDFLYRRIPHPVALIGRVIGGFDAKLNRARLPKGRRLAYGVVTVVVIVTGSYGIGILIVALAATVPGSEFILGLCAATLIAQNSLYRHVSAVVQALAAGDLEGGREAVAQIVGRDTKSLDEHEVARASIESLAENFSDGVVAPVFWALLFGLPGLLVYKAVNTADSMIGYRNERYRDFGWAAARLDDALNWVPARLSALLILVATLLLRPRRSAAVLRAVFMTASHHHSPNAGYPEAAMAGALDLRLGGPRTYRGETIDGAWMGMGRAEAATADIHLALWIFVLSCAVQAALLAQVWLSLIG